MKLDVYKKEIFGQEKIQPIIQKIDFKLPIYYFVYNLYIIRFLNFDYQDVLRDQEKIESLKRAFVLFHYRRKYTKIKKRLGRQKTWDSSVYYLQSLGYA